MVGVKPLISNIFTYPRTKPWPELHSFSPSVMVTLTFCFYPEGATKKPLVMSLIPKCDCNCNKSSVLPEVNRRYHKEYSGRLCVFARLLSKAQLLTSALGKGYTSGS